VRVAYLDPVCGISGDMFVACFLDAGLDLTTLKAGLETLPLEGFEISCRKVLKKGLSSTLFIVRTAEEHERHRNLPGIISMIEGSGLSAGVKRAASEVFRALADAEAKVHGVSPEDVGFHEVGAVDSIVDIVSAAIALEATRVDELLVGPLPSGRGTVRSAHGPLPVPAPATVELLNGFELVFREVQGELVTPTGAAIVKALGRPARGLEPMMELEAVGYGAGTMDLEGLPNVARVFLGETRAEARNSKQVDVIEATIDDASPQIFGYLMERLLNAGAYDVFTSPVTMKKSRPGVLLTVLAPVELADSLIKTVFKETPTLGVRVCRQWRRELERKLETVSTRMGDIIVKVSIDSDGTARGIPEYESCASVAKAKGLPLWQVWNEARRAWEESQTE
jgi:uncharacterized protein (TIGR00299 family) protein